MNDWFDNMVKAAVKKILDGTPYLTSVVYTNIADGKAVAWYEDDVHVVVVLRANRRSKKMSVCFVTASYRTRQVSRRATIETRTPTDTVVTIIADLVNAAVGPLKQSKISELLSFVMELKG